MNIAKIMALSEPELRQEPKNSLIRMALVLRQEVIANCVKIATLEEQLRQRDEAIAKLTKENINKIVNQPSSKQPEFDKETGQKKKKRKKKRRGKRKGCGNRPKPEPEVSNHTPLSSCPNCHMELTDQPVAEMTSRIVEDIVPVPEKTIVSEETGERKWCPNCKALVSSASQAALPRSDIGIRATALIAYLWVVGAMPLPGIAALLSSFFRLTISTTGLSKAMIRLGTILGPVHNEILGDVKSDTVIFADETGWRIKGVLWWLWIFANRRSAYYWPDRQRGSPVVAKILGPIFLGVLVTDAWCAYKKIICAKQTCMAHIMRKIRKFRDAFPQYYTILMFYQKLRRIITDGERLKSEREKIGEQAFARRLRLLKERLQRLLAWKDPNKVLKEIIEKVARQQNYILTFVEHVGVPSTNNFGEYVIKRGILKRKVSGGSMSVQGAMAYAVIQSVAMTCHLRGIVFHKYLLSCLLHYIRTGRALLLSEYEQKISTATGEEKIAA